MAWLRRLDRGKLIGLTLLVLLGTQLYYHNLSAAGEWPRQELLVRAVLLTPSVEDLTWKTQFPALPWLPVVALGFLAASRVIEGAVSLGKLALRLGLGCLIVFAGAMLASSIGRLYPAQALILTKHPPDPGLS